MASTIALATPVVGIVLARPTGSPALLSTAKVMALLAGIALISLISTRAAMLCSPCVGDGDAVDWHLGAGDLQHLG